VSVESVAQRQPGRSDAELLAAFRRQADQGALAELIGRHHRLVLGVCQQLLGNSHDAQDAYQATFLVLLRKSHRIRHSAALGSWLYGVAFRVASRIRQRRARTRPLDFETLECVGHDPLATVMLRDQQAALHAAIVRLPEKLRQPIVLRYLLGHNNLRVARQLAISEAAVEGRIKRAKSRLRRQLTKQGVTMVAALATLPLAGQALEASERLIGMTVERCLIARTGGAGAHAEAGMPRPLSNLVTEEMRSMLTRQFTHVALVAGIGAAVTGLAMLPKMPRALAAGETITVAQEDAAESSTGAVQLAPTRLGEVNRADLSLSGRPTSASEQRIMQALEEETHIKFLDEPLADAMEYLAELHHLQYAIDQAAMDELGISTDTTVTAQFKGISLSSGLSLILRQLGLTYIIRDEVLTITTPESADSHVFVRLYPYRSEWPMTLEQLAEAIHSSIAPDTWDEVGGDGVLFQYNDGLVVSQTQEVHEQILDLLVMLSRQAKQKARQ
jgi:RNA polymerase sigma factor (sigma-70 family)